MKSNLLKTLHALTVAISLLLVTTFSAFSAEFVSVTKDGANVRTGPSTDNPVYMELFKGYPLQVIERKGEWVKITDFEKDSGWIHSSLTKKGNTVIVSAKNKVNMRSGPGTSNAIVANIDNSVILEMISRKGNWVNVKHLSGTEGWIYAPLLWP